VYSLCTPEWFKYAGMVWYFWRGGEREFQLIPANAYVRRNEQHTRRATGDPIGAKWPVKSDDPSNSGVRRRTPE
jgi:hypothetical protein